MSKKIKGKTRKLIVMDEKLKLAYQDNRISRVEFKKKHKLISDKIKALKKKTYEGREKERLLAELLSLRGDLAEGVIDHDMYAIKSVEIHKNLRSVRYPSKTKGRGYQEEYKLLNGILFLSFVVPVLFAILLHLPMNFFYWMVIIWVHEAGHGFWCLLGSRLLCAFGGMLNEMLFTAVPALICFTRKEIYLGGCILIMCAGMSIQYNGVYMQSAGHPYGMTSFAGALTGRYGDMTEQTHDWSIIFGELGVIQHSYGMGKFTEEVGRALAIIFLTTSVLGVFSMMYGWLSGKLTSLVGVGAIVSAAYFILSGASGTEIILALLLSAPLLKTALNSRHIHR